MYNVVNVSNEINVVNVNKLVNSSYIIVHTS
jgi:hypothetical protein